LRQNLNDRDYDEQRHEDCPTLCNLDFQKSTSIFHESLRPTALHSSKTQTTRASSYYHCCCRIRTAVVKNLPAARIHFPNPVMGSRSPVLACCVLNSDSTLLRWPTLTLVTRVRGRTCKRVAGHRLLQGPLVSLTSRGWHLNPIGGNEI
jgi:hypothetical protein